MPRKKVTQKQLDHLQYLASSAQEALDEFTNEFRRLSSREGWKAACDEADIDYRATPGDWMC